MESRLRFSLQSLTAMAVALAILVFTTQPRSISAQALSQFDESEIFVDSTTTAKPDLKAIFDKEIATLKSGTTKTDFNRFNPEGQTSQTSSGKFTRKQQIFLTLWIVCMTAIVIVAIKHPCREKKPHDCDPIEDYSY